MADDFSYIGGPNWGPLANIDTSNLRQAQTNENIAQTMKAFGDIAMQPVEMQLKQEQARAFAAEAPLRQAEAEKARAQADQIRQAQATRQRMLELVQRQQAAQAASAPGAPPPPVGPVDAMLSNLSKQTGQVSSWFEAANQAGDLEAMEKLFPMLGQSAAHATQAVQNMVGAQKTQHELDQKKVSDILGVLQETKIPWAIRKNMAMQLDPPDDPREKALLDNMTEDQVPAFARSLLTQNERQDLAIKMDHEQVYRKLAGQREGLIAADTSLAKKREEYLGARIDGLKRAGVVIKEPTREQKVAIENDLREQGLPVPKGEDITPGWAGAIRSIAANAQIIQDDAKREGKKLSPEEAKRQAIQEEIQAGTFQGLIPSGLLDRMRIAVTKPEPAAGGRTPATPMPWPDNDKGIPGRVYKRADSPTGISKFVGIGRIVAGKFVADPKGTRVWDDIEPPKVPQRRSLEQDSEAMSGGSSAAAGEE